MNKPVRCTIALPSNNDLNAVAQLAERLGATVLRFATKNGNADTSSGAVFSTTRPGSDRLNPDKLPPDTAKLALEGWLEPLVNDIDDIIVLSPQGIRLLMELASQLHREAQLMRALNGVRRIAYGIRPAAALRELGLPADIIAQQPSVASLRKALESVDLSGRAVGLIPRATDPDLLELIAAKGGLPRILAPFEDTAVSPISSLVENLISTQVQALVFSSPEQVRDVWRSGSLQHSVEELRQAFSTTQVIAVGLTTARALEQVGITSTVLSSSELACASPNQIADLLALGGLSDVPLVEARTGTSLSGLNGTSVDRAKAITTTTRKQTIVVIGNGMVGYKLIERLTEYDRDRSYEIVVFCEEPRPAYDRVQLTSYFGHRTPAQLLLADRDWYEERGVRLLIGEQAVSIDRERRAVLSSSNEWTDFDYVVMSTGSSPFVPSIPGIDKRGVFVYRTIEDLEAIIDYAGGAKRAVILGGGLLGLEAAKAAADLGLETQVVEFAPRLMPRQLDDSGARLLARKIEALGVKVQANRATARILGEEQVTGIAFSDGAELTTDLVIVSAGIRPRDALARQCGLKVGERGGIVVDDQLLTSDPRIFAVGECALHRGTSYGLVAPGYEMAETVAKNLVAKLQSSNSDTKDCSFTGTDQSAKLKLLGVDVASLGDPFADNEGGRAIVYEDLVRGVYKKLVLSSDCKQLLGASLVGDAAEYGQLLHLFRSKSELPSAPEQLILGSRENVAAPLFVMPDTAQVCSCNNVTRKAVCSAIRDKGCATLNDVKAATRAGTGCGGCVPLVTDILNGELRAAGQTIKNEVCEHFSFSRQELYQVVKINKTKSFEALIGSHGKGHGCEICKPVVASILASVHNDLILKHASLQDTNDRYLANIQRGGSYSVVPRVPAGEITPNQLIAIGVIAKKYGLYTKITGGQRIDMFGAKLSQLPDIWTDLVQEGFESGHAYGKAMRTVKSCVGSAWCRYGVQDSVAFAIRVEERYKGIRAPHKLKSAVSGCVRECAEAQSKDFGLIATEKGYNLYVCGNGGAKPRHADLLATDLDEDTAIQYIDRFLMYYISTADRLTRTAAWLDKMDGGITYLRDVLITDHLGICAQLERDMQQLVDGYQCEWAEVVNNPELRARFRHFADAAEDETGEFVIERGQRRPADWPKKDDRVASPAAPALPVTGSTVGKFRLPVLQTSWVPVARVEDVPKDGGIAIKHGNAQIALFNFASRGEWYATQNTCPHKREQVLARGLIGDQAGDPKVACPLHKKTFSLASGDCLNGEEETLHTFPVKVQEGVVYVHLPEAHLLERVLATHDHSCEEAAECRPEPLSHDQQTSI